MGCGARVEGGAGEGGGRQGDALALEAVEVLGEGGGVVGEVVVLDEGREDGVGFVEAVEEGEEVARAVGSGGCEEVAEGWGEEVGELILGEEFCAASDRLLVLERRNWPGGLRGGEDVDEVCTKERGFMLVDTALELRQELHGGSNRKKGGA